MPSVSAAAAWFASWVVRLQIEDLFFRKLLPVAFVLLLDKQ
jgi:hypothetical protein